MKNGKCLTRKIWAGTDKKFIFKQVPVVINSDRVINRDRVFQESLPEGAKHLFAVTVEEGDDDIEEIWYANQIVLVKLPNAEDLDPGMFEFNSYLANADDVFAEDWFEVNP